MPVSEVDVTKRWTNAGVARVVLGLMACMAAIALVFALATISKRRANDRKGQEQPLPAASVVSPVQLEGMAYLPEDVNFVSGVHVSHLQQSETGKLCLNQLRLGVSDLSIADIENQTGLKRDEIDHLVTAIRLSADDLPGVYMILHTRRPYDQDKLLRKLKASMHEDVNGKTIYTVALTKPPASAWLWMPTANVLMFGLNWADVKSLPATAIDKERSDAPVFKVLRERMGSGTDVWVAAAGIDWQRTRLFLMVAGVVRGDSDRVTRVLNTTDAFAVGWRVDTELDLKADVQCKDAATAQGLLASLNQDTGLGQALMNLVLPGRNTAPLAAALQKNLKGAQENRWVAMSARASAETLRATLQSQP